MRNRVLYYSRKERTKKVAEAISTGARITSDPLEKHTVVTDVGILFLGSGIYFGKVSGRMRKFATSIDPKEVKLVVVFSTAGKPSGVALDQLKTILEPKGIKVHDEGFFCRGSSIGMKYPGAKELKEAEAFGQRIGQIRVK